MTLQVIAADDDAAQRQQGVVDVVSAFAAHAEATHLVQPTEGSFHDPAMNAQAAAVGRVSAGQDRFNAALPQLSAMRFRVVGPIALDARRATTRSPAFAAHGRNRIHEGQELRHVVSIGSRQRGRKRNAGRVGDQVMFAAGFAAICRIGSRFFPPWTARTEDESTIARDQSIRSACCRWASSAAWTFCQTPCCCQAWSRRQAVIPDPQPSSCGRCSHGRPVLSTNKMADSARRLSIGLRPGERTRRGGSGGSNGSMIVHNRSSKIGLAMRHLLVLPQTLIEIP